MKIRPRTSAVFVLSDRFGRKSPGTAGTAGRERKNKGAQKGVQSRETPGFGRPLSAHTSQKNTGIHTVFRCFSISSERTIPRPKLLRISNREIIPPDEAISTAILDMYCEHYQRSMAL